MELRMLRLRLYNLMVNRVAGIGERYHRRRKEAHGLGRLCAWLYLLWLNISYYILHNRDLATVEKYSYYEEKELCQIKSESALSVSESPVQLADRLAQYDVISFDVFDTLIFRPFSEPTDLFYFVGKKLVYPDFKSIRCEMEKRARQKLAQEKGSREVKLSEIYEMLSQETGIDAEEGIQAELYAEYRFCYANPYMYQVIQELVRRKKRIIVISDMYLDEVHIRHILKKEGYPEFAAYYISCEHRCSKGEGTLYEIVKKAETEKSDRRMIHVGDNYISDVEQAKKHGLATYYYRNVNQSGMPYRAEDMSVIAGSIYRGIVNAQLHNGLCQYSFPYEYGFVYGGWFVIGYCQFIHSYVKQHKIEKVLFLARDGDVLSKAYARLYPEENQEYVYWSRLAATKLTAKNYKYDFFRRFLYQKVNQENTIDSIFKAMELEAMEPELEEAYGLQSSTRLTGHNVELVKRFLMERWTKVLQIYEPQIDAAGQYYREVLSGYHKVAAVDIGWAGSGAITLSYMVNQVWKLNCEVTGILAGTNSCYTYERNMSEAQLESGMIVSYLFSQKENRDIWKLHHPGKKHNLYWEILLDSPQGSLKGFYPDEKGVYQIVLKKESEYAHSVELVHAGIMDFVDRYLEVMGDETLSISGRDAYAPMILVLGEKNKRFKRELEKMMDEANV